MDSDAATPTCCPASEVVTATTPEDGAARFFTHLFDTSDYPPRWFCGNWNSFEGWLHIVSDAAIFGAYFTIPIVLLYFILRRRDLPFPRIIVLFGAFILSCGAGHLLEAVIFWHPVYRAAGLLKCFTAVVSWITVLALIRIVPRVLHFPGIARLNERLSQEIEQRQRSESHTRAILETAADAIITIDAQGLVISMNSAAERMFGYAPDEVIGRNISMLMPTPYRDEHDQYLRNYLASGVKKIIGIGREALAQRKDGGEFPIELAISEVRQGESRTFTGVVRDITARKESEEELRRFNEQLREAGERVMLQAEELKFKTRDLEEARRAADLANRSKDEFLANMSHELRTPMTAILGFAEILVGDDAECIPAERADAIQTIRRNGEHLLELINDILDLSKIEAGKLEIERIDCSPWQIIEDVVGLMRVRAQAKNLPLEAELEGPIPATFRTDPTRLRQVLINLVGNAIKFTELGSVRVIARIAESAAGSALEFRVVDTGIGMDDAQVARLFRPFTQADTSITRNFGGTGLGLAISRRLAETLGGALDVVSRPGQGTTFTVLLPIDLPAGAALIQTASDASPEPRGGAPDSSSDCAAESAPRSAPDPPRLAGRILLAEDGVDNQRLISFVLRKAGAEVTVVENGKLACEAILQAVAEGLPYDMVLMDMQMPVLDGYSATRRLRQDGYDGVIVALTAHAMSGDRQRCLDAGCDDYATKPIERRNLIALASRHMTAAEPSSGGAAD
ncbi:MAG: PAS domain S-box protein [Pirellulaceae bacterium]